VWIIQYDGEMTSHYAPAMDGMASPLYDHQGRVAASSLPLPPSAALPRSPAYSPHPSATAAVSSLASPYSAGGVASAAAAGYASAAAGAAAAAAAAAAMNSSSSSVAAVAAVDSLLKRDKDAIYRQVLYTFDRHTLT